MTTTDWVLGGWDVLILGFTTLYLLRVLIYGLRHYENGYKPIRWLLFWFFIWLSTVNLAAIFVDFDFIELTDMTRVVFALGRGAATFTFAGLVWWIRHKT